MEYERKELYRYSESSESILILMKDTRGLIGACTGIPLQDEDTEFVRPFQKIDIEKIFYIGEVMVLADSRGKGIGTKLLQRCLISLPGRDSKQLVFTQ